MTVSIYNTLTRKKEPFKPLEENKSENVRLRSNGL